MATQHYYRPHEVRAETMKVSRVYKGAFGRYQRRSSLAGVSPDRR